MTGLAFRARLLGQQPGGSIASKLTRAGRPTAVPQARHLPRDYAPSVLAVIALYYAAAHLGYAVRFSGPVASMVWLPVGVGIAALYLGGLRLWPGIVVGDLLVNNYSTLPVGTAIGQSFGNLLEVVVAVVLLRQLTNRDAPLATIRDLAGVLVALVTGTLLSATIGSLSSRLGGVISANALGSVWRTWWLGDLCGALIVVPLALAWLTPSPRPWLRGRAIELTLLLAVVAGLSVIAISEGHHLSYLPLPAVIWVALRFGPRGATLAIAIGAAMMMWGTTHYLGPFAWHSLTTSLLDVQLYLVITSVSALAVGALAAEREVLADRVRASRTRIVVAADEERRRLERDLHDGAQQRLIALAARLGLAVRDQEQPPAAVASLDAAQSEILVALEELRELVHGIRPAALRQFGLARAVEGVAARSSTPVALLDLPEVRLDDTAEATAYYVVLEGVANAQRHAHASIITIRARVSGSTLLLEVQDDGVGGAAEQDDLGLQGLRDRVEATGGDFTVDSEPGCGTLIRAAIPATASTAA
jgi:signal transduction histidine kinase